MPDATAPPQPEELSVLWHFTNPFGSLSQQLVVAGDRLLGVSSSTVFAADIYQGAQGTPGFPYTLQSSVGGDPYVTAAGGHIYLMDGSDGQSLIALRLVDGQPPADWTTPTLAGQVVSLSAVAGKVVAVHTDSISGATSVSAFDGDTGAASFGPVKLSDQSPGPVAYGQGAIFFVAANSLIGVNVDFGDQRWTYAPQAGEAALDPSFAPLVTDKLVLAAGDELLALDVKRGKRRWSLAPAGGGQVKWATPALDATGKLAIVTNSGGDVFAVSPADGTVVWSATVPNPGPLRSSARSSLSPPTAAPISPGSTVPTGRWQAITSSPTRHRGWPPSSPTAPSSSTPATGALTRARSPRRAPPSSTAPAHTSPSSPTAPSSISGWTISRSRLGSGVPSAARSCRATRPREGPATTASAST